MNRSARVAVVVLSTVVSTVAAGAAGCSPSPARQREAAPAAQSSAPAGPRDGVIDHLTPRRDSVGPAPAEFTWTPVAGADSYAIGVWNEVDVLVWRQNGIPTAKVTRPADVPLEAGTYFWSVSALRDGQQIAESGLAAFVVRD